MASPRTHRTKGRKGKRDKRYLKKRARAAVRHTDIPTEMAAVENAIAKSTAAAVNKRRKKREGNVPKWFFRFGFGVLSLIVLAALAFVFIN